MGVHEAGGDQASGGVDRLGVRIDFPFDSDYPPVLDKEVKLAELTGAGIAPQHATALDQQSRLAHRPYLAPSFATASRKFLTVASGVLRAPSGFVPCRLTQITGMLRFIAGTMSVS